MVDTGQVVAISCTVVCVGLLIWCVRRQAEHTKPLQYLLLATGIQSVSSATAIAGGPTGDQNNVLRDHLQAIAVALVAVAACMLVQYSR